MTSEALTLVGHEKAIIESLVIILCTSTVVALVCQRIRIALIPSYLIAGVLVGPSGLAFIQSAGALEEIGHLAVVLLLFGIGMELHLSALRKDAVTLLGTSLSSCLFSIAFIFAAISLLGVNTPKALVIAMAFSLSSTALVLRLLARARELTRGHGQLSLAILVTQDLLVLFMLAAIPFLGSWLGQGTSAALAPESSGFSFWESATTASILLGLFIVGQKLLPRLLLESLRQRSTEVLMLTAVSAALLGAFTTYKLGFSLEMGAFLIGFLLAASPFRHQLAGQVGPLRDLFMAIFFTVLGMKLNLSVVASNLLLIGSGTLALLLLKTFSIFLAAWLFGVHSKIAILTAVILAQAGEFSLIILDKASEHGLLSSEDVSITIGIVVLSLILTPSLFTLARITARAFERLPSPPWIKNASLQSSEEQLLSATGEHVIVAGYGPVGRAVTENLIKIGMAYTVIELNSSTVKEERVQGINIIFGNLANESVLEAVEISGAKALIITFSDPTATTSAASKARLINPNIEIIARASSLRDKQTLEKSDIHRIVIDEESTAKKMVLLSNELSSPLKR